MKSFFQKNTSTLEIYLSEDAFQTPKYDTFFFFFFPKLMIQRSNKIHMVFHTYFL